MSRRKGDTSRFSNHLNTYNQHNGGYCSADEYYTNEYNGQQNSLSPPPYIGHQYDYNNHHHNNDYHHNNGHRGRRNRGRERGKERRPKTPSGRGRKPANHKYKPKQIRSSSQSPPKELKNSHTKHKQEPYKIIQYLQTLHNMWMNPEQNKSVNVRNLALYLRKAVNGYQNALHSRQIAEDEKFIGNIAKEILDGDIKENEEVKSQPGKPDVEHKNNEHKEVESQPVQNMISVEVDVNDGLVQFGNNIRKFCECYCNYLWKGNMNESGGKKKHLGLPFKIKRLSANGEIFPDDVMEWIKTLNKLVHSVDYGRDAAEMYLDKKEQCLLLSQLCEMAEFVEDKLVDEEGFTRIE